MNYSDRQATPILMVSRTYTVTISRDTRIRSHVLKYIHLSTSMMYVTESQSLLRRMKPLERGIIHHTEYHSVYKRLRLS